MAVRQVLGLAVVCLGLAACQPVAAPAPKASAPPGEKRPPLVWDSRRPLTWEDFQGTVPEDQQREGLIGRLAGSFGLGQRTYEAARTASTISAATYRYAYECSSRPGFPTRCKLSAVDLQGVHAEFDPNASWMIPEAQSADLLRHEQGHFDIAALYAARLQTELNAALTSRVGVLERESADQPAAERAPGLCAAPRFVSRKGQLAGQAHRSQSELTRSNR
jgi:hypothetical protein